MVVGLEEGVSGKGSNMPKTHGKEHAAHEKLQVIAHFQNVNCEVKRARNKTGAVDSVKPFTSVP